MKIIEVNSETYIREFLLLPVRLYKNDIHWIRPMDQDIEDVFNEKKNKFFRHGICKRWLLQSPEGKTIGRVAAFVDRKTEKNKNSLDQQLHTGGMGFFECEENQEYANLLFNHCKDWLQKQGMNSMEGPINFGTRDNWWGLLTEGHDIDPNLNMPYSKPYYQKYFEDYGFQVYFKQLTYGRKVNTPLKPTFKAQADKLFNNPRYEFKHMEMKQLEKYTEDFRTIYNKAWGNHAGAAELTSIQAKAIMKSMKPIIDPIVVYFAYYDNEPVAFFLNLPEVNQIFKRIKNGKLNWIGKLKFIVHKLLRTNKKLTGRAFGIIPEHQGKGVVAAIVEFSRIITQEKYHGRYIDYEMNWIGDFNPKMMKIAESIGEIVKVHNTYRVAFDSDLVIERCKVID